MTARWLIVALAAAAILAVPTLAGTRPTAASGLTAAELAARVQASASTGWSGVVESEGTLRIPDSDSFATLAQLLGEANRLRAWWRADDDWRVDRLRSTGETDLFRRGGTMVRWVFESQTATLAPASELRLPDASDLLPPTLGRAVLQGARPAELSRLPARRVAGIAAAGLRLAPEDPASSVARVDLWVDPTTGLVLSVELYGRGEVRPAVETALVELDRRMPLASLTEFRPAGDVKLVYEEAVDVAAAANAFAPYDLPPRLGGLASRDGTDPAAVGIYGRGPTTLIALPLRGQIAGPLRERIRGSTAARETSVGTLAPVGPISLLVTPRRVDAAGRGRSFLLTGTVTADTLERAATELLAAV